MFSALAGSVARTAARMARERARARNEALRKAGYRCPSCGTDQVPTLLTGQEKLTFSAWLRGGFLPWLFRRFVPSTTGCPNCRVKPDLSRWLGGTAADWQ